MSICGGYEVLQVKSYIKKNPRNFLRGFVCKKNFLDGLLRFEFFFQPIHNGIIKKHSIKHKNGKKYYYGGNGGEIE